MCSGSELKWCGVFCFVTGIPDLKTTCVCLGLAFTHLEKYLIPSPVRETLMTCVFVSCLALFQVKKIMNGVFQSLRGEFELEETYSGRTVLGVVMSTIKVQQQ